MAHPFHHSESSMRKYGGNTDDYLPIHQWFDESKRSFSDNRHRALRHHAEGIFLCEQIFGVTITTSAEKDIPVRFIGEQHVQEHLGWISSAADWLKEIRPKA